MSDLKNIPHRRPCGTPGCTSYDQHPGPCTCWEVTEPRKRGRLDISQIKGQLKGAAIPAKRPTTEVDSTDAAHAPAPAVKKHQEVQPPIPAPSEPSEVPLPQEPHEGPTPVHPGRPIGSFKRGDPLAALTAFLVERGGNQELTQGWSAKTEERAGGATSGQRDCYYISPSGKRFRSRKEVARHLGLTEEPEQNDDAPPKSRSGRRPPKGGVTSASTRGYEWVQCDSCDRWRRVKVSELPADPDAPWFCSYKYHMRCAAPAEEEEEESADEEYSNDVETRADGAREAAPSSASSMPPPPPSFRKPAAAEWSGRSVHAHSDPPVKLEPKQEGGGATKRAPKGKQVWPPPASLPGRGSALLAFAAAAMEDEEEEGADVETLAAAVAAAQARGRGKGGRGKAAAAPKQRKVKQPKPPPEPKPKRTKKVDEPKPFRPGWRDADRSAPQVSIWARLSTEVCEESSGGARVRLELYMPRRPPPPSKTPVLAAAPIAAASSPSVSAAPVSAAPVSAASVSAPPKPPPPRPVPPMPAPHLPTPSMPTPPMLAPSMPTPPMSAPPMLAPPMAPMGMAPMGMVPMPMAPVGMPSMSIAPTSLVPMPPAPVSAAPVSAAPVSAAAVSAAPVSAAPVSAAPVSAAPVSAAPVSAAPVSAAPVPVSATPTATVMQANGAEGSSDAGTAGGGSQAVLATAVFAGASATAAPQAAPPPPTDRASRSIAQLMRELVSCYGLPGTLIDLDDALTRFPQWKKRRLYDVLAVCQAVRCVEHTAHGQFVWHGVYPSRVKDAVEEFLQRDRAVRPLLSRDEADLDPDDPKPTVTGLAFLTQQFVLLLRQRAIDAQPPSIVIETAVTQLCERIKATDEKAVHRRVYDILNILESIGLLGRSTNGLTKEGFYWKGTPLERISLSESAESIEPTHFEGLLRRPQKKKRVAAKRKREEDMAAVLGTLASAAFGEPEPDANASRPESGGSEQGGQADVTAGTSGAVGNN